MVLRIGIGGIAGRMGREIVAAAAGDPSLVVVGGVVRAEKIGSVQATFGSDFTIVGDVSELLSDIDVLIDFTNATTTVAHADACATAEKPFVTGVTGLTAAHVDALQRAAEAIPVFYARNMSLGISALVTMLPALVRALSGYDIEITETHHRHKQDAPSGTALVLAEAIAAARATSVEADARYGRQGHAPRRQGEIGIHAVRAGGNAGEHTILLADEGEEIRVSHRALSRRTFALGALRAAAFVATRPPGFVTMTDLIAAGQV